MRLHHLASLFIHLLSVSVARKELMPLDNNIFPEKVKKEERTIHEFFRNANLRAIYEEDKGNVFVIVNHFVLWKLT